MRENKASEKGRRDKKHNSLKKKEKDEKKEVSFDERSDKFYERERERERERDH